MQEASLPSPDTGANGYHLRRISAKAISALEVVAMSYPAGAHPGAQKLADFFTACAVAAATIGKAIPVLTLTPPTSSFAVAATQQLTLGKGGSSGAATYSSSDPAVATVNSAGLVTGVAAGTAVITANVAEGSAHKAGSITASVTVTA
jgi:hypothetical protein